MFVRQAELLCNKLLPFLVCLQLLLQSQQGDVGGNDLESLDSHGHGLLQFPFGLEFLGLEQEGVGDLLNRLLDGNIIWRQLLRGA